MPSHILNKYNKRDLMLTKLLLYLIGAVILIKVLCKIIAPIFNDPDQILKLGSYSNFTQYNPIYYSVDQASQDLSKLQLQNLIEYNPSSKQFEKALGSFLIEENSNRFRIRLAKNMYWSDGEAIDADDVLFSFNQVYLHPEYQNPLIKQNFHKVEIQKINQQEITFTIPEANIFFISNLEVPIFPEHKLKNKALNQITYQDLSSSSNYQITDEEITENYIQYNFKRHNKQGHIKNISYQAIFNKNYAIENQKDFDDLIGLNSQDIQINKNKFSKSVSLPRYQAVFINTENSFLKNINVRKALNMAANKKDLVKLLPDKQIIANPFFQFDNITQIPEVKTDIIQNLLKESGFVLQDKQFYYQDQAVQLTLTYPEYKINPEKNQTNQIIVKHLVKNFAEIGITLIPQKYELDVFQNLMLQKEFDLLLYGHDLGNNFDAYSFWHSSQSGNNKLNLSNLKDPLVDNLLLNLRKQSKQSHVGDLIQSLNKKLKNIVPAIFLYTENNRILIDKRVKNRKIISDYTNLAQRLSRINKWKIK